VREYSSPEELPHIFEEFFGGLGVVDGAL